MEPALRIRRARDDEAHALAPILTELCRRSKAHWGYDPELLRRWADDLRIDPLDIAHDVVLVAEVAREAERIVGFARITEGARAVAAGRPPANLKDLWIEPGEIGAGVGRALFAASCEVARTLPADQLLIVSDPNAEGFYLRMGARRVGEESSEVIDGRRLPILLLDLRGSRVGGPVTSG